MGMHGGAARTRRGPLAALALVLVALFATGGTVAAQTPPPAVGVEITPARIQRDLPNRSISEEITVINHEAEPRKITLTVSGLGHDLDGAPSFFEKGDAPGALTLSQTEFTLASAQSRKVSLAGSIPSSARSLYAAVVAEFAPLTPRSGQIEVRSRVASLLLYRAPKPWHQSAEIVDVQIIPGEDGAPARVSAAIKATGDVHVNPTGTAQISKDGRVVSKVALAGQLIIPTFARRLNGAWIPTASAGGGSGGLRGIVTITVRTQNPPTELTKTIDLGGGVAERPQAEIVNLRAGGENGGRVSLVVRNVGKVPVTPVVTLFARRNGIERARVVLPQKELKVGTSTEVTWEPSLPDGVYLVTAQVKTNTDLLDEATTDMRVGAAPAVTPKRSKRTPFIALASLLLLVVGVVLLFLVLRRRKEDEDPGAEPRPPARAVASPAAESSSRNERELASTRR